MQSNADTKREFLDFGVDRPPDGTLVFRGDEDCEISLPLADLPTAVTNPECQHCGEMFTPRKGTGGRPQIYCSAPCRTAANATRPKPEPPAQPPSLPAIVTPKPPQPPQPPEFDWWGNNADVVIPEQQGIAVYENLRGEIVIRQKRDWCDEDDTYIAVQRQNLRTLIDKLVDMEGDR